MQMRWMAAAAAALALAACASPAERVAYRARVALAEVQRAGVAAREGGAAEPVREVSPQTFRYADALVEAELTAKDPSWITAAGSIRFSLRNRSNATVHVIWDEAVFIFPNRTSSRVVHEGTSWADRNQSQAPTPIPPGTLVQEEAIPASRIWVSEGNHWQLDPLLYTNDRVPGARLGLMLPIQTPAGRADYTFWFEVFDPKAVAVVPGAAR
jgi:hypothetical protein